MMFKNYSRGILLMKSDGKKIYLDSDGYQQILKEIKDLNDRLAANGKEKGEAYSGAVGDGWHDNFAFDQANMEERMIVGQLRERYAMLENAVIVEKQQNENLIDINDVVVVNMIFGPDDYEEFKFKLVGALTGNNSELQEISINSPLGKSVYRKEIGEKVSYKVENRDFNVEILSKNPEKNNLVRIKGKN